MKIIDGGLHVQVLEPESIMTLKRPVPFCSFLALLAMPLLAFGSIPFWTWYVTHQIASAPFEGYAPDPGQFAAFGVAAGSFFTGVLGAVVGIGLAYLAKRRNERWWWLRVLAFWINGIGIAVGTYVLLHYVFR